MSTNNQPPQDPRVPRPNVPLAYPVEPVPPPVAQPQQPVGPPLPRQPIAPGQPPVAYPVQPTAYPQQYPQPGFQQSHQPPVAYPVGYQPPAYQQPPAPPAPPTAPLIFVPSAPAPASVSQPRKKKKGSGAARIVINVLVTLLGLSLLVCCGGFFMAYDYIASGKHEKRFKEHFNLAEVPIPDLPKYNATQRRQLGGADLYRIPLGDSNSGRYSPPGHGGSLFYYLPPGNHPSGSLPCMLITAAGTTLLTGAKFDQITTQEDAAEHLPYVDAGMAVMVYEMDGGQELTNDADFKVAYNDFKAACAGMVNARNAFEYVLKNCPEVNKDQIFTAGHSSAGAAALLFAAHEPRVAGCVVYAPCADVENFHPPEAKMKMIWALPGLSAFMMQSSPTTHAARIRCPLFLFNALDDTVVPMAKSKTFAELVLRKNPNVRLQTVASGGHYDSMIDRGIPDAIDWINAQTGRNPPPKRSQRLRSKR